VNTTSISLLFRLRQPGEQEAWRRFVDLYTPLIYYWGRRVGLQEQDAADLVQDVLAVLVQRLPAFEYDRTKSFRSWLRTVTLNKWREKWGRCGDPALPTDQAALEQFEDSQDDDAFWEVEYRQQLVSRALALMQTDFEARTWQSFWESVVVGRSAADVAEQLGISVGAVYAAKFRVLTRLREELAGLTD
jgi:RNA polymerase sigma-70 factor (ECF subfamily)